MNREARIDQLVQDYPELWAQLYPRLYPHVVAKGGQYYPSPDPARFFLFVTSETLRIFPNSGEVKSSSLTSERRAMALPFHISLRLAQYGMQQTWISAELAFDLLQTTPPVDLNWTDMQIPFESMIFVLPKGALTDTTHGDVCFVAYSRIRKGDAIKSQLGPTAQTNVDILAFVAVCADGSWITWNLSADKSPVVDLRDLDGFFEAFITGVHGADYRCSFDAEYKIEKIVMHYIFGALLLMTEHTELVTEPTLTKRVQRRGGTSQEWWSPRILGGKHIACRRPSEGQGGTHASPRLHWRCGHWTNQPYGPKHSFRRRQWVKACIVNLDVAAD